METETDYGCEEAQAGIAFFFHPSANGRVGQNKRNALLKAFSHMEISNEPDGGHSASCQSCLEFYLGTKKKITSG